MAKATSEIVLALRNTAARLRKTEFYQWGHMGCCNCGYLAQEVARLTGAEIHRRAMERSGDWSEQLNDYCPTSGLAMDELIQTITEFGFSGEDLKNLERLSDPHILKMLPFHKRYLHHNIKDDVVLYIETWAGIVESEWMKQIDVTDLSPPVQAVNNKARNLLAYSPGSQT